MSARHLLSALLAYSMRGSSVILGSCKRENYLQDCFLGEICDNSLDVEYYEASLKLLFKCKIKFVFKHVLLANNSDVSWWIFWEFWTKICHLLHWSSVHLTCLDRYLYITLHWYRLWTNVMYKYPSKQIILCTRHLIYIFMVGSIPTTKRHFSFGVLRNIHLQSFLFS